jgi:hypothetical protein
MRLVVKNILFVIVILIVSGCGMMGHSSKDNSSQIAQNNPDKNITDQNSSDGGNLQIATGEDILPKNISMDFPSILKQSNPKTEENSTESNNSVSIGYSQLKKYISQIDDVVKIAQINLVLLKKAMPQVLKKCEGMSSCTFEPNYISIVLDNETISQIDEIVDDKNFTYIDDNLNKKVTLGELEFKKEYIYIEDGYKYDLKLDLTTKDKFLEQLYKDENRTEILKIEDNKTKEEYQIFKWYDYTTDVTTIYFYKDENKSIDVRIFYSVDEDGKESMHILNSTKSRDTKNNMNLTLSEKDDDNETLQLTANSIEEKVLDNNKTIINSFSSNGEISDESSLILFSGNVIDENKTKESPILSEVICNSSECIENNLTKNISDNNSSDINESDINHTENSDINYTYNELNESVGDLRENLKFYQIKISDTNLSDGSYIILPPYTNIDSLTLIDIFKLTIGTFTILDGKAQGEIHSNEYNDMLDELTIVKIEENLDSSEDSGLIFKVVENSPKIEIIDPLTNQITTSSQENNNTKEMENDNNSSEHTNINIIDREEVEGNITQPRFYLQPQYLEYIERYL